jgi:hypothetical protein
VHRRLLSPESLLPVIQLTEEEEEDEWRRVVRQKRRKGQQEAERVGLREDFEEADGDEQEKGEPGEAEEGKANERQRKKRLVRERTLVAPRKPTVVIQAAFKSQTSRITVARLSLVRRQDDSGSDVYVLVTGAGDGTVFFFAVPGPWRHAAPSPSSSSSSSSSPASSSSSISSSTVTPSSP